MFKKWDIILIILLILLSFIPELVLGVIMNRDNTGTYAEITVGGKLYKSIALSEHKGEEEFKIKTNSGYNLIKVKDNSISIIDADCPDKVCEKPGYISKAGQSLVCLPHKLMVEVKSYDNSNDDEIIPAN